MAFGYLKSFTVDHTQCGSFVGNYVICIGLGVGPQSADPDLRTVGAGGYVQSTFGYDIRPYLDSALTSPRAYELVYYDGATGSLEMHVFGNPSHFTDEVLYLAFGNPSLTTDGSSTTPWSTFGIAPVWHLPNGTTLTANDSSGLTSSGTITGATATSGDIDGGAHFGGSDDITVSGAFGGLLAFSCWFNPDSTIDSSSGGQFLLWVDGNSGTGGFLGIGDTTVLLTGEILTVASASGFGRTAIMAANFSQFTSGTWYHVAFLWNGSKYLIYINGVNYATTAGSSGDAGQISMASTFAIGTPSFVGKIDEMINDTTGLVVADWFLMDYNSQKASSTFLTWGARTAFFDPATMPFPLSERPRHYATLTLIDYGAAPCRVTGHSC